MAPHRVPRMLKMLAGLGGIVTGIGLYFSSQSNTTTKNKTYPVAITANVCTAPLLNKYDEGAATLPLPQAASNTRFQFSTYDSIHVKEGIPTVTIGIDARETALVKPHTITFSVTQTVVKEIHESCVATPPIGAIGEPQGLWYLEHFVPNSVALAFTGDEMAARWATAVIDGFSLVLTICFIIGRIMGIIGKFRWRRPRYNSGQSINPQSDPKSPPGGGPPDAGSLGDNDDDLLDMESRNGENSDYGSQEVPSQGYQCNHPIQNIDTVATTPTVRLLTTQPEQNKSEHRISAAEMVGGSETAAEAGQRSARQGESNERRRAAMEGNRRNRGPSSHRARVEGWTSATRRKQSTEGSGTRVRTSIRRSSTSTAAGGATTGRRGDAALTERGFQAAKVSRRAPTEAGICAEATWGRSATEDRRRKAACNGTVVTERTSNSRTTREDTAVAARKRREDRAGNWGGKDLFQGGNRELAARRL